MQPTHSAIDDSHRTRMTREGQAARRRRMAEAVKGGLTVEEVARAEEMTIKSVQTACRQHGVAYPDNRFTRGSGSSSTNTSDATSAGSSTPVQSAAMSGAGSG